jgi:hypothetical protein
MVNIASFLQHSSHPSPLEASHLYLKPPKFTVMEQPISTGWLPIEMGGSITVNMGGFQ